MARVTYSDPQSAEGLARGHGSRRKRAVGNDSHKSRLRHGARSPTLGGMPGKPALRPLMRLMPRPRQRDQHIHVQQKRAHSLSNSSSKSSLTRSLVIRGESAGRSNTAMPFTIRVFTGGLKAFRTNSETASPNPIDRLSA